MVPDWTPSGQESKVTISTELLPAQMELLCAIDDPSIRWAWLCGGAGCGKTRGIAHAARLLAHANPPAHPGHKPLVLLTAPDYTMLQDVTWWTFLEVLEEMEERTGYKETLEIRSSSANFSVLFRQPDGQPGARVVGRHLHNWLKVRGRNAAAVLVDEMYGVTDPRVWTQLQLRLRDPHAQCLKGLIGSTPVAGHWFTTDFLDDEKNLPKYNDCLKIVASTFDNYMLTPATLSAYGQFDSDLAALEIFADTTKDFPQALVFHEFDMRRHVREMELPPNRQVYVGVDFGLRHPHAIFFAILPKNVIYVFDEIPLDGRTTIDLGLLIGQRARGNELSIKRIGCDPAGKAKSQQTGVSDIDALRKAVRSTYGRPVLVTGNRRVDPVVRLHLLKSLLRDLHGTIRIFFHPRLKAHAGPRGRGILRAFQEFVYHADMQGKYHERLSSDTRRLWSHAVDSLSYGLVESLRSSIIDLLIRRVGRASNDATDGTNRRAA